MSYAHNDIDARPESEDERQRCLENGWDVTDASVLERWRAQEPINAHSHLAAMLLGSSETVPVTAGRLVLGQWQSVMLVDTDGPRERRVGIRRPSDGPRRSSNGRPTVVGLPSNGCRTAVGRPLDGRQTADGRSSDGCWTVVGRPLDSRRMVVGRSSDGRWMAVGQSSNDCQTAVGVSDGRETIV